MAQHLTVLRGGRPLIASLQQPVGPRVRPFTAHAVGWAGRTNPRGDAFEVNVDRLANLNTGLMRTPHTRFLPRIRRIRRRIEFANPTG